MARIPTTTSAPEATPDPSEDKPITFEWKLHAKFLYRCLQSLGPHQSHDINRMTLVFFCLSGLDLLPASKPSDPPLQSAFDEVLTQQKKTEIAEWILSLQVCNRR